MPIVKSQTMPKTKSFKPRNLPDWANEPLKFSVSPDDALADVMKVKPPKDWSKVIKTGRKSDR